MPGQSLELFLFLGYEVSNVGVNMLPDRVKAIKEWEPPQNLKALQSFLGFCNFYRGFIHQYSEIVVSLTNLTKKNVPYVWTELQQKSFGPDKACLKRGFAIITDAALYQPALTSMYSTKSPQEVKGLSTILLCLRH